MEIDTLIRQAEDYVRRNLPSRTSRDAQKRRLQRKMREFLRRLRRAGLILAALLAMLIGYSILVAPINFLTWVVAIPTILLFALLSMSWPTRRKEARTDTAAGAAPLALDELAARVEDGLIDRRQELPGRAIPAADSIIFRLNELQPHLAGLDPASLEAGEVRRLVGEHLPRLIDSYLSLPARSRSPGSEAGLKFSESLDTVSGELDHLLDRCCRDRHLSFETQNRFIESRYREHRGLRHD